MFPQTTYHTGSSLVALARARAFLGCLLLVAVTIFGVASGHADSIPLYSFNFSDGANPQAKLVQASDGNFYGTTVSGGASGQGTIFKITPSGMLTTLYSFSDSDGANPRGDLIQAGDGDLYGTASGGGANGLGTVFKITLNGILTTIYSFGTGVGEGSGPYAGLVQGSDGNFYGTTVSGGPGKRGTIFQITPGGVLTTLHTFDGLDGEGPFAGLVQGSDGYFYGTTADGGGLGILFRITSSGSFTTVHNFHGADGASPTGTLVQGSDGDFYGTTGAGGGTNGYGTVFKITSGGSLTTLYFFSYSDGANPYAGLVQGSDGDFYGTTTTGGASGSGTAFKITSDGNLTTLYNFSGTDGANPSGGLVQGSDGNFYGTTEHGGANVQGTVFKITVMVAPTNTDQCKNGGWMTFTSPRTFKNQGDCIQFVNTGK